MRKVRTVFPAKQTTYQAYKPYLRAQFYYACAYCELWERENGGYNNFGVDHYNPDDGLVLDYGNLLYACNDCNRFKSSYWPNLLQQLSREFVLNPFTHDIENHIDKSASEWKGKSTTGIWNVNRLRLRSPERIRARDDRINFRGILVEYLKQIREATQLLDTAKLQSNYEATSRLENRLNRLHDYVDSLVRRLYRKLDSPA